MHICTIQKVELRIDPLLLALCIPAALFGMLEMLLIAFAAVMVHELAHVLVGALLGVSTESISILPFGGVAKMGRAPSAWAEFIIALAGPAMNLLVVAILVKLFSASPSEWMAMLVQMNLAIGLFNLVPAYPLDGGRLLHAALRPVLGVEMAKRVCCALGMVLGGLICLAGIGAFVSTGAINVSLIGIGGLIVFTAYQQNRTQLYGAMKSEAQKRARVQRRPVKSESVVAHVDTPAQQVVSGLSRQRVHLINVVDDDMRVVGTLTESQLLSAIVSLGARCTMQNVLDHLSIHHVK